MTNENNPPDLQENPDPQNTHTHQHSTDQPDSTPSRRGGARTVIAVVAAAALAGTGGVLIGQNIASGESDDASSSTVDTSGAQVAQTVSEVTTVGENRGLESVHQGGGESLENVLVSTEWLAEQINAGLEENNIVLIDVSEELASSELTRYVDGHIEGAQFVDWSTEFLEPNVREFIDADGFTQLAQGLGINNDSTVIIYGDNNNWFAAYAAWVFKLYGAEDVRLLDGGLKKWEQVDGRELVQDVPQRAAGDFEAKVQNFDVRAFQPEVLDVVNGEIDANLVDIRFEDEFNGEVGVNVEIFANESTTIWGHIPGAANVPWGTIVNEDGTYKPAEEIRAIYEEAGVDFSKPIIAYCRIGERASHTWYALSQILEADVKVYDGSWTEWGNTVGVPVANNTDGRGGVWNNS